MSTKELKMHHCDKYSAIQFPSSEASADCCLIPSRFNHCTSFCNNMIESTANIYRGDGFSIENNIIKGSKRKYDWNNRNIGQLIFDALSRDPQHVGLIDAVTGKATTFAEMKERSVRLAIWMIKEGVTEGDIVALCTPNHPDVYTIIFATMYIGATYSPWDHEMNLKTACTYVKTLEPKIVFTYKNKTEVIINAAKLENYKFKIIGMDSYDNLELLNDVIKIPTHIEVVDFKVANNINLHTPNLISFSSGTTGFPKAVSHSYDTVLKHVVASGGIGDRKDVTLTYFFPAWAIHMWFLLDFILTGTTEIFHSEFDPTETCKIIQKYKVNILSLHTYKLMLLQNANVDNKYNLESINFIVPIGTKLSLKAIEKTKNNLPNALISKRMGMTETGEISRYTEKCKNPLSEGIARPNVEIKILDLDTGKTLGPNKPGELCVKVPTMMIGYHKNSKETAKVFDEEGWLHSGDEAYFDENGELVIVGRLKEIIKYRYYDVHPAYIEELLVSHPNVIDAAVVPVPHYEDLERPMAFVKLVPGSKIAEDELVRLTSRLEYNGLLDGCVRFVDELPRTTNGKINKHLLKELAEKSNI